MGLAQSFRVDGSLQFDDSITPYVYSSRGTVTTIDARNSDPHYSNSSPSTALIPMNYEADELILLRMDDQHAYARYANLPRNGSWNHIYHTSAPVGTTVYYYRFVQSTTIVGDLGYGLHMFNEGGQRTFHSNMRPLIPVAILDGVGSSTSLNTARTYASLVPTLAGRDILTYDGTYEDNFDDKGKLIYRGWNGQNDGKLYGVQWLNNYTPRLTEVSFNDVGVQTPADTQPPNQSSYNIPLNGVMIVDVTGL